MRPSEWLFVSYFAYIVILSGLTATRRHLHGQPVVYRIAAVLLFVLLSKLQRGRWEKPIGVLRMAADCFGAGGVP